MNKLATWQGSVFVSSGTALGDEGLGASAYRSILACVGGSVDSRRAYSKAEAGSECHVPALNIRLLHPTSWLVILSFVFWAVVRAENRKFSVMDVFG